MKLMIKIVLFALILYVAALVTLYLVQRSFMYHPPKVYLGPADIGLAELQEQDLTMTSAAGADIRLTPWWSPPEKDQPVIVVFHGNGSSISSGGFIYGDFITRGYGVLGISYPGYPGAGGTPNQADIVSAAKAQVTAARQEAPDNPLVFYGSSLGAGVAAQIALQFEPDLLIMEAPFTSALDLGKGMFPYFPIALLMQDKWLSQDSLAGSGIPLLWIHGTNDTVIPFSMGELLYQSYPGPKTSHTIEGGTHVDAWISGGREVILDAIEALKTD